MKKALSRMVILSFAVLFLGQSPPPAQPPAKTSVAIYQIKPAGVDASLAAAMTMLLGSELTPSTRLKVIEEAMLKTVMERQGLNASDACDDSSCQVEVGKLVKAQKIITGGLAKLGNKYILSLHLVDVQSGATEFSTKDECSCSEDQLDKLIAVAAAKVRNHFGENLPIPSVPVGQAFLPVTQGSQVPSPAQPSPAQPAATNWVPGHYTIQESHPPNTKGGPMFYVSDFKFYIDKYEVTNQDFQECVSAGVCQATKQTSGLDGPKQPMVYFDQNDAKTYCQWAGKRVPTNAEWESSKSYVGFLALDSEEKQKQEELQKYKEELDRLIKEFHNKSPVWSEDTKRQKASDLDLGARSLQRRFLDYQDQMQKRHNELINGGPVSSFVFRCARDGSP